MNYSLLDSEEEEEESESEDELDSWELDSESDLESEEELESSLEEELESDWEEEEEDDSETDALKARPFFWMAMWEKKSSPRGSSFQAPNWYSKLETSMVLDGFWMEEEVRTSLREAIWVVICLKEGSSFFSKPTFRVSAAMMTRGLKSTLAPEEHPK